jgi:hypothetical protein
MAQLRALSPVFQYIRSLIFNMQSSLAEEGGREKRGDDFFYAFTRLCELSEDVPPLFLAAGFPDAAAIFQAEMRARMLKYPKSLKLQIKAALLNPHVSAEAAVAGMPEVFERMVEDVEDELIRYCAVTAPTPSQGAEATPRGRGRGRGAVDVALQTNQYLAWRRVKNPGMTGGRTLNEYWLAESAFSLLRQQALSLAAFAGSGAALERVFSQARASFDYFMGAFDDEAFSERLCVKVNADLLVRFA